MEGDKLVAVLKRNSILIVALGIVLIAALVGLFVVLGLMEERFSANRTVEHQEVPVEHVDVTYSFEPEDTNKLVGFAKDVFIGRVVEEVGAEGQPTANPGFTFPQTQFSVEVRDNIKGNLTGKATVNQEGGYVTFTPDGAKEPVRELLLIEGAPLLKPGEEYVFSTTYTADRGWHNIATQPYGARLVGDEPQRKELKDKFEKAKREQVDPRNEDPSDQPSAQ